MRIRSDDDAAHAALLVRRSCHAGALLVDGRRTANWLARTATTPGSCSARPTPASTALPSRSSSSHPAWRELRGVVDRDEVPLPAAARQVIRRRAAHPDRAMIRTPSSAPNHLRDTLSDAAWVFVLPYAHDGPTGVVQRCVNYLIAVLVLLDLGRPVLVIPDGRPVMVGAAVPEAAVDEDCDLGAREHDVRCAPQLGNRSGSNAISEAKLVSSPALERSLRRRSDRTCPGADAAAGRDGRPRARSRPLPAGAGRVRRRSCPCLRPPRSACRRAAAPTSAARPGPRCWLQRCAHRGGRGRRPPRRRECPCGCRPRRRSPRPRPVCWYLSS